MDAGNPMVSEEENDPQNGVFSTSYVSLQGSTHNFIRFSLGQWGVAKQNRHVASRYKLDRIPEFL